MLGHKDRSQMTLFIPGSIDQFIPEDHILKKVDRVVDFSWIRDEVGDCYCPDNGRPGIDPECALRLMLAGFFHGIVHDRKLMREAQVNLAIRWFAGYGLDEDLPHHSSLGVIRDRWGADRFKLIFQKTVEMCAKAGLVNVETVHVDATLIRADVSWESLSSKHAEASIEANQQPDSSWGDDRQPPPPSDSPGGNSSSTKTKKPKHAKKRSSTDPDASMATSSRRYHLEPTYKQHTAVDDGGGVIVDVSVTTGEASEGEELLAVIDRVEETTGAVVERVTGDAGYSHPRNYQALEARGIAAVIPPQPLGKPRNKVPLSRFKYDENNGVVRCPRNKILKKSSRAKNGWLCRCPAKICRNCDLKSKCVPKTASSRTVLIVDGYAALLRARRRWPHRDKDTRNAYGRHRFLVEGVHGEAKNQHCLRRAVRRGLSKVAIQAYLTAAVINLKRLLAGCGPDFALLLEKIFRLDAPKALVIELINILKPDPKKYCNTNFKPFWTF